MVHVQVMCYVEKNDDTEQVGMLPGIFPAAFVRDMFGEAFLEARLADGTLVPVDEEEPACG